MSRFPSGYTNTVSSLTADLGPRGNEAYARLSEKGFVVTTGLSQYFAGAVSVMAEQSHIAEYCPNDQTSARFAHLGSTAAWLRRGRGVFLLLQTTDIPRLAGYAWSGEGPNEKLPDHPITSAYRLGQRALGKGLGADFVQTVVSATESLYAEGAGIGLETWQSNHAAQIYPKVGFQQIAQGEPELRPTLDPAAADGVVKDVRVFMGYSPQSS